MTRLRQTCVAGLLLALLLAMALSLPGCAAAGIAAGAVIQPKNKAVYKPKNISTLVLVDDPAERLGDTALPGVIASNVAFHLRRNKAITDLTDPAELTRLSNRLGSRYARTPIDRIGREVGARQVISVYVASASLASAPGFYRPTATVQVKVIDVETGRRLFPAPDSGNTSDSHPVHVVLDYESSSNHRHGNPTILMRSLCEEVGKQVAQLFYDHKPPEPGSKIGQSQNR